MTGTYRSLHAMPTETSCRPPGDRGHSFPHKQLGTPLAKAGVASHIRQSNRFPGLLGSLVSKDEAREPACRFEVRRLQPRTLVRKASRLGLETIIPFPESPTNLWIPTAGAAFIGALCFQRLRIASQANCNSALRRRIDESGIAACPTE